MNKKIITLTGYDEITRLFEKLKKEKIHWVEEKRIAAEQGDRSENAEYIGAKENIRNIDRQLYRLDRIIRESTAVDTSKREVPSMVLFGSIVKVLKTDASGNEEELSLRIVGTLELIYIQKIVDETCISSISPLGYNLIRKEEGEEIEINNFTYEVLEILS